MKTKILVFLLMVLVSGFLFIKPAYNYLSGYLSKSEPVSANILLVEGWLQPYAIEMAWDEFNNNSYNKIITTGLNAPDYFLVSTNGFLVFYPTRSKVFRNTLSTHLIEIDAYSELGGENSSQFNVFINDSLVANFLAEKKKKKYSITWRGRLSDIDSVLVQFVNDGVGDYGDRNLYIKEIIFDNQIEIPYQTYSEYDIGDLDGKKRIVNNFSSYADLAKRRLLSLGIDSSVIISIPGKRVNINRTLTSALAFRDWLDTSDIEIKGINIVTIGTHARRTWMTYSKILNEKYDIGIISLPDHRGRNSNKYKILKTIRETIGIVYYWIILIPY
jgi:hypothetical protein